MRVRVLVLRRALGAEGLVVGGVDTQERLTEFATDALKTTSAWETRQKWMRQHDNSPPRPRLTAATLCGFLDGWGCGGC